MSICITAKMQMFKYFKFYIILWKCSMSIKSSVCLWIMYTVVCLKNILSCFYSIRDKTKYEDVVMQKYIDKSCSTCGLRKIILMICIKNKTNNSNSTTTNNKNTINGIMPPATVVLERTNILKSYLHTCQIGNDG